MKLLVLVLQVWCLADHKADSFIFGSPGRVKHHLKLTRRDSLKWTGRAYYATSNNHDKDTIKSIFTRSSISSQNSNLDNLSLILPSFALSLSVFLSSITTPAWALSIDPTVFNGQYADPFHPLCERNIQVSPDGTTFHYSGTAVGPKNDPVLRGCTIEEQVTYGLRQGAFDGFIIDGYKVSVGDGIHEGVWEPAGTVNDRSLSGVDLDGIRWNDGNKWTKIESQGGGVYVEKGVGKKAGEWVFLAYVIFSLLAGVKGVYDKVASKGE